MGAEGHQHSELAVRVLVQRGGVPYELERIVCRRCHAVLAERPLRRAAA